MDALQQMYQQLILEHAKKPQGRADTGPVASFAAGGTSHQVNPTCGDEITLRLATDQGKVTDLAWSGHGCSISQASASVMTDLALGADTGQVRQAAQLFHELMQSRGAGLAEADEDLLGDATAFTGVSQYPARIKCALLGWVALKDALAQAESN